MTIKNKKTHIIILLLLVLVAVASALMISILAFGGVYAANPINITSAILKPVNPPMIPTEAMPIDSSIGASEYYYHNNVFFRRGNSSDGDMILGKFGALGFGYNGNFSYLDLSNGRHASMAVLNGGIAFVTSRKSENKIPLIELVENALVVDNQYLIQTDNFFVYLTPATLFANPSPKSSPVQIDTYALYYFGNVSKYYLKSLVIDEKSIPGKIIIDDKNELFIVNRNQIVNINGNIVSTNSLSSKIQGLPLEWQDIDNKWISIKDIR